MPPKVYAGEQAERDIGASIRAPQTMDFPVLIQGPDGQPKTEFRTLMNSDSFAVAGAIGEEDRTAIAILMHLGKSGLFQLLTLDEAQDMIDRLQTMVTELKESSAEEFISKHKKMEVLPAENEDEEDE